MMENWQIVEQNHPVNNGICMTTSPIWIQVFDQKIILVLESITKANTLKLITSFFRLLDVFQLYFLSSQLLET